MDAFELYIAISELDEPFEDRGEHSDGIGAANAERERSFDTEGDQRTEDQAGFETNRKI